MAAPRPPDWSLPRGVNRSLWEYAHADHIATEYDSYFAENRLFQFDEAVLVDRLRRPGRLIDLGCGSGRLSLAFAARGFSTLAVDLSRPMLRVVGEKARQAGLEIDLLQGNLVELDAIADASADYCICMFSTLGMICGQANRARALDHVRRILKPDGLFVAHVHNRWYHLHDPQGRLWLATGWLRRWSRDRLEAGDKVFEYRRIPRMRLHTFTRREFLGALRAARFDVRQWIPLDARRQDVLRHGWWLESIRANGWIAVCAPAGVV